MKAEMKAVVASLVVIALALTAVSGVTYSWFSDTEEAKIDVSTAKINISGVFTDASVADPDAGATASFSGSDLTLSNISAYKTVNAKYTVKNESSVDTKYRMYVQLIGDLDVSKFKMYVVESSTGEPVLGTPLSFVDGIAYVVGGATSGDDLYQTIGAINYTVEIQFGNLTSEDMGKSFKLFMITEAYQSDYTFTAPIGSSGETSIPEAAKTDGAVISGVAPAEAGSSAVPATVKVELSPEAVTAAMDSGSSLTLKTEMKEVGGNPVLSIGFTDSTANNDFGKDVTVTVTVPGTSADDFKVVFLGSGEQPTNVTKKDVGSGMVEITFTTTHFSDYIITVEDIVAIADVGESIGAYASLSDAVADAGEAVILVNDVTINETIIIDKDLSIILNGKNITGNGVRVFHVQAGIVDITGEGTIESTYGIDGDSSVIRVGSNNAESHLMIGELVVVKSDYSYGITVFGKEAATLELDGTVITKDIPAISGNGTNTLASTDITIGYGAKVTTTGCPAIYHPQAGTLTVKGTVNGGIEAKAGEINIEGSATISSNDKPISHVYNSNGPSSNGYAITIVSNAAYKGPAHLISDKATINGSIAYLLDDKTITGEIAALAKTSDDKYFFDTLELAFKYAPEKSTIVLLKDVDVQKITIENRTVTLDLNEHNINLAEKIYVQSTGSLDIIGTGVISSETQGIRVQGSDNPKERNHLTVGKDVTVNAKKYYSVFIVPVDYITTNGEGKEATNYKDCAYSDITLEGTFNAGLYVNGHITNTENASTISISNATVNGSSYLAGYSIFHADDVKFTSTGTPLLIKSGNITIENSSISSTLVYNAIPIYASSSNGDLDSNCLIKIDNKTGYVGVSSFKLVHNTYSGSLNTYVLVLYEGTEPTGYEYDLDEVYVLDVDKSSAIAYIDNVKVEIGGTIYTVTLYFDSYETAKTYWDTGDYTDVFGASAVVKDKGTLSPAPSSSA